MSQTALIVTASINADDSLSRRLTKELLDRLVDTGRIDTVIERDLSANDLPLLTSSLVGAFYTPEAERTDEQNNQLKVSDTLLSELKQAKSLVIGTPMYNFSVPAVLKAWIDLICRVGESFKYTSEGPQGLLDIDDAYLVVSTGGAPLNSAVDFVVPYLTQVMKFIGVKRVHLVAADKVNQQQVLAVEQARQKIQAI